MSKNDGWIAWDGGDCPVSSEDKIEVHLRIGNIMGGKATMDWVWRHTGGDSDIIAYRVIENDGREG